MVSGGMTCVKYLLFCFNLLFAISGVAILAIGIIVHLHVSGQFSSLVHPSYQIAPIILIVVGVVIFIVAFFGCCGAVKESHCMTITFSIFLAAVLILEVAAGIVGYVHRSEVEKMLDTKLNSTMYSYYTNADVRQTWNVVQHEFQCCGINGPEDWRKVTGNDTLPYTCCPNTTKDSNTCSMNTPNKYNDSCLQKLKTMLVKYASVIAGVGLGIAAIQFFGIIFACTLARHIRLEYETV